MDFLIFWLKYASPPDNMMSSWMPGDKQNKVVGLGRGWISQVRFAYCTAWPGLIGHCHMSNNRATNCQ